jgi:hypothetical protein
MAVDYLHRLRAPEQGEDDRYESEHAQQGKQPVSAHPSNAGRRRQ